MGGSEPRHAPAEQARASQPGGFFVACCAALATAKTLPTTNVVLAWITKWVVLDKEWNSDMKSVLATANVTVIRLALLGLLIIQEPLGVGR